MQSSLFMLLAAPEEGIRVLGEDLNDSDSGRSPAYTAFLWVLFYLITLVKIFALLVWRVIVGAVVFAINVTQSVYENRLLVGAILILLVFGIPLQVYPETVMTAADQVYECAVRPAVQIFIAVLDTVFDAPYTFIAQQYNTIALLIGDSFSDIYGPLRALSNSGSIASVATGSRAIAEALFGGDLDDFWTIFQDVVAAIGTYLADVLGWFLDAVAYLADIFNTWFIQVSMFSGSCSFCSADPSPRACALRSPLLPGQSEFDCDDCHELSVGLGRLIGQFLDTVTGSFLTTLGTGTSFERIGGSIFCVLRSLIMYPIYIIAGLVEGCIAIADVINVVDPTSFFSRWWLAGDPLVYNNCAPGADSATCCGKPGGCTFPSASGEDYPIGILPCLKEFLDAVTGGAFSDFVELILQFLLPIVGDVVATVERVIECADDPAYNSCLRTYPNSGSPGDPGFCEFTPPNAAPTNGVFRCFELQFTCLSTNVATEAPLLEPLVVPGGVLEFLLGDFFRFSLDPPVCAIIQMTECFDNNPVSDLDTLIDALNCTCQGNPVFGPIIGCPFTDALAFLRDDILAPIINTVEDIIEIGISAIDAAIEQTERISETFECVLRCGVAEIVNGEIVECFDPPLSGNEGCEDRYAGATNSLDRFLASRRDQAPLPPPTEEELQNWWALLYDKFGVTPNSFCGNVLSSTLPGHAARGDYGTYVAYMGCLGMYSARRNTAKACGYTTDNMTNVANYNMLSSSSAIGGSFQMLQAPNCTRTTSTGKLASKIHSAIHVHNGTVKLYPPSFVANINASSWRFMPDIAYPIMNNIRNSPYGVRAEAFFDEYRQAQRLLAETDKASPRYTALETHMENMYVEFANDILARYRTGTWRNATRTLAEDVLPGQENETYTRLETQYVGVTGKVYEDLSAQSMRDSTARFWDRLEELHLVEAADKRRAVGLWGLEDDPTALGNENVTMRNLAIGGKKSAFALSPDGQRTWKIINEATQMGWWPRFAQVSGIIHAVRARDGRALMGMIRGRLQYRVDTDEFVSSTSFALAQPPGARALQPNEQPAPTLLTVGAKAVASSLGYDLPVNTWSSRYPRNYAPFPVPLYPAGDPRASPEPSWIPGAVEHLYQTHTKHATRRKARLEAGGSLMQARRQHADADFDFNMIVIRFVDGIIQLFTRGTGPGPLETLTTDATAFFSDFNFLNYTLDNVTNTLDSFVNCSVPNNIAGPDVGSPFCLFLMYEDAFTLLAPEIGSEFGLPVQLPFPDQLITDPCVSTFSGSSELLTFEFSNDCNLPLPPSVDVQQCDMAASSCVGDVTLTMNPRLSSAQDEMEFTIDQNAASASCAVTQATMAFPQGCANLVNVTGDCVTSFSLVNDSPSPDQDCLPLLDSPSIQGTLVVDFSGNAIGNTCTFVVKYSTGVVPTVNPASFFLTGENEPACSQCSLRFPTVTCRATDAPPVDLFRDDRPLCDTCDYCAREYQSCADAGFADALDSLLYVTGNLGFWLDELVFNGLDAKTFELWYAIPVTIALFIVSAPFIITCVGIPVWIVGMNFARVLPWSFFIFFGGIVPWPVILGGLGVYSQLRDAKWWEVLIWIPIIATFPGIPLGIRLLLFVIRVINISERLVEFFRPLFVIIGIVFVVWLATLVFETPSFSETLRINDFLQSAFIFFDSSFFFLYLAIVSALFTGGAFVAAVIFFASGESSIPYGVVALVGALVFGALTALFWYLESLFDFTGPIARIREFTYDSPADVTDLQNFCFAISWWNISILLSLGIVATASFRFAYRGVFAVFLWILDIILWIFAIFFTTRRVAAFSRISANAEATERNTNRIKRAYENLRKSTAKTTAAAFARIKATVQMKPAEEIDRLAMLAEEGVERAFSAPRQRQSTRQSGTDDSGASASATPPQRQHNVNVRRRPRARVGAEIGAGASARQQQ